MQMTQKEYYIAPSDSIFNDIKANAIKIWQEYEHPGYVAEKLAQIDIENIKDNAWYIVGMFDLSNQMRLLLMVETETADMIRKARGY